MLVACLTSLVALNGKNHAGTGNSAAFTVTQPLERAQNDAFGPPTFVGKRRAWFHPGVQHVPTTL